MVNNFGKLKNYAHTFKILFSFLDFFMKWFVIIFILISLPAKITWLMAGHGDVEGKEIDAFSDEHRLPKLL